MNPYDDHDDQTTFLSIDLDLYAESEYATVDHPDHYGGKNNEFEVINVIEAWDLDFHCGSVIKYIARHKKKGHPKEDIDKAIWYLERYRDQCLED